MSAPAQMPSRTATARPGRDAGSPSGVQFPLVDGHRSSTVTARAVVADAARPVDADLATRVEQAGSWRSDYLGCIRDLTAVCGRSPEAALGIARAGLQSAGRQLTFTRSDREVPLHQALDVPAEEPVGSFTLHGDGPSVRELSVPYNGTRLHGDSLRRQLDDWVRRDVVEPSFARAIELVDEHPDWLALPGRRVALIGAGSEMGPLAPLAAWGADILAVDIPRADVWQRVLATGRAGAGRLTVPVPATADPDAGDTAIAAVAGLDITQHLPETHAWLTRAAAGRPLVLGTHAYADGAAHVQVSLAADVLAGAALRDDPRTALAYLATPTDSYLVPSEVVEGARRDWEHRGLLRRATQGAVRAAARGRLFAPQYGDDAVMTDDGARWGIADALVPQQGPNYALAKRLQRWRGVLARAAGHDVSFNVAPASWTRSVTKNRVLAAAYGGAHHFGVEIFAPQTTRVLMAALLVHDLHVTPDDSAHPEALFCSGAAHGGLWRAPYDPRSVLGIAAAAGVHRGLRPARA